MTLTRTLSLALLVRRPWQSLILCLLVFVLVLVLVVVHVLESTGRADHPQQDEWWIEDEYQDGYVHIHDYEDERS